MVLGVLILAITWFSIRSSPEISVFLFATSFDLRIPVGLMFTVFGLILVGVFGGAALPEKSSGLHLNLWWGLFQLVFGVLTIGFGLRASRKS